MENHEVREGKTMAIISYITIFGTIAAFIMNYKKRNSFAGFHIKQMIGIFFLSMINKYVILDYAGRFFGGFVFLFIASLWLIGFIGAVRGQEKVIPFLGEQFQEWFKNL
jgi:uncharacterized membrane protein